jgi:hypothetical protein
MSQKEPNENPTERRDAEQQGSEQREDPSHTPSKAEGDEATIDEALGNE